MKQYSVEVSGNLEAHLDSIPDEEVEEVLMERLRELTQSDNAIEEMQEELHDRMGISTSSDSEADLSPDEAAEAYREKLRRQRRYGAAETR